MIFAYYFIGINALFFDTEGPTDDDVLSVNKNLLNVYRINGEEVHVLGPEGDWEPAKRCEVIVACGSEFHEPV